MSKQPQPPVTVNSWLEDELYQTYLHDRATVDQSWNDVFRTRQPNGHTTDGAPAAAKPAPPPGPPPSGDLTPLRGAAARIAENMSASLSVPVATSLRIIPVKVIDENRQILNQHRTLHGQSKISYTHLVGWAIVKAVAKHPAINNAYAEIDGEPHRAVREAINLGIAIDVAGKDGARSLMVPSIKDAGSLDFQQYLNAFDDLVSRARKGKLTPVDFQGTSVSLTNPGTVGTVGSMPRLMAGQGAIIATGAIDYPAEYQGVSPAMRAHIGISKVMTVTCTYDHRIIQGAESGMFLAHLQELLQGDHGFYESLFADMKLPYHPVKWEPDATHASANVTEEVLKNAALLQLINAYRVRGHLIADFDPLGGEPQYHPELDPATYGLTIWDLDRQFYMGNLGGPARKDGRPRTATLREILQILRATYCGRIGCEFMNISSPEQKRWLQEHMEPESNSWPIDPALRKRMLKLVIEAEQFEHFLGSRFVGQKRFALEGSESAMAILDALLGRCAEAGAHEAVIGMAHRGRLTVLANLLGKPMEQIFHAFEGEIDPDSIQGTGDVKYHLGASGTFHSQQGNEMRLSLSPNPSHLEAVNPVVQGIVRPKQDRLADARRERVIPLLIHGDAAFAGQGVVTETLNLSQLDGYTTGGTIHLIINNQIGFTTNPRESRSTHYCTEVARTVQAPILHVNGDDPDACCRAAQLAYEFRQVFKKDVVIDMFCYRRHGHNEGDDPSYTQPIMYRKIKQQKSVAKLYAERLVREGILTPEEVDAMRQAYLDRLKNAFEVAQKLHQDYVIEEITPMEPEPADDCSTAISQVLAEKTVRGITALPEGFRLHPKLKGFLEKRREALSGAPMDWATAEAIAFGSLVLEGTPVRLSGQDSARGTFTQRHLELYDYEDGTCHIPMQHLDPNQARFDVWDSSLSEYAVMGFEFGYSLGDPLSLVMWEGQFGDFANGAQIMIDQFIAATESKWGQPSGLVLLLPHGYEGQGPEHSSARIERFLQLCAENNIQVANCTTPAQYFHLLRRQMRGGPDMRGVRKPLIVFSPKSMLRHPRAVSYLSDLMGGTFQEVMPDTAGLNSSDVDRILFCSGKIYWELAAAREERGIRNIAIVRMEQLYPFPQTEVRDILASYSPHAEVLWVQEEPRNMGAWQFIRDRFEPLLDPFRRIRYVGRAESASPATGSSKRHTQEQTEIVEESFAAAPLPKKKRVVRRKRTLAVQ